MNTNNVVLVGNLVDEPDVQVTASGAVRTRIRIAHTERRRDPSNDTWSDGDSLFLDVVSWRRMAEHVGNSLSKGDRVVVTGRLRQWTADRDGNRRTVVEIEADSIGVDLQRGIATIARPRRPLQAGDEAPVPAGPEGLADEAAGPPLAEPEPEWVAPLVEVGAGER